MYSNNGVFKQLKKLVAKQKRDNKKFKAPLTQVPRGYDLLIGNLQNNLEKVQHKSDSIESRIVVQRIMAKYFNNIDRCLSSSGDKFIITHRNAPVAQFQKTLGTGVDGSAALVTGLGRASILKFAVKVSLDSEENVNEGKLMEQLSKIVQAKNFPNFPIAYFGKVCKKPLSIGLARGPSTRGKRSIVPYTLPGYVVLGNELADETLFEWYTRVNEERATLGDATGGKYAAVRLPDSVMKDRASVLAQMILTLAALNVLGLAHNDSHLNNWLVHHIKPGGYWKYKIDDITIFVPNRGHLIVLWDYGRADRRPAPLYDINMLYRNYQFLARAELPVDPNPANFNPIEFLFKIPTILGSKDGSAPPNVLNARAYNINTLKL